MRQNASVESLEITSVPYEEQGSKWFTAYFRFIERRGKFIFGFWIIVLLVSLWYGPKFLKQGDDSVKPPKGTPSWYAQNEFEYRFKQQAQEVPLLVLIQANSPEEESAISPSIFSFARQLKVNIKTYNETTGKGNVLSILSYYDLDGTLLDGAKTEFVSQNNAASFINVMVRGDRVTADRYDFVKYLKDQINDLNPDPKLYNIGLTGFDALAQDSADDIAKNVAKIDSFSVPFAMALLGFMIRSWRLLMISFFNLGCAILSSFALMAFLVNHAGAPHPESASAQLMEVMTLAVSIDWSLFLNRRFRDEIKRGASAREASYIALMHSGHVVIMSGLTLMVVFIGFIGLPAATVQMDGACCSIGVALAMLVALTNTPAFWLLFPDFCADFNPRCCKRRTVDDLDKEAARLGLQNVINASTTFRTNNNYHVHASNSAPLISSEDNEDATSPLRPKKTHVMYSGPRFRFTKWVTKFPNNVLSIVLVYILVLPLAIQVKDLILNQDVLVSMPRNSGAAQTYKHAFENFPGGTFAPFYIMVTSKNRQDEKVVLTPAFYEASHYASSETAKRCKILDDKFVAESISGPSFLAGKRISYGEAKTFLATAKSLPCNPIFGSVEPWWKKSCSIAKEYEFEYQQAVNEEENSMLTTIIVPFFPFAQESHDFIDVVYEVLDDAAKKYPNFDFYFCGVEVGFDALQRRVVKLFPQLILTTFIIVFSILGFLLRSAFVPIRLALTLVAPLCAVFGLAVLVYQKGALEWTGIDAFSKMDGFFWYIPILLLSMIIGLSLDWDVLLISRIMEHRENGFDINASICKAVCETGGTISVAGIIMCLAFGAMLLSDQLTINACGFVLTVAILFDTFVVNTVLVPALISIGDNVAWWPVKMPMNDLKTLQNCDEFPQDD